MTTKPREFRPGTPVVLRGVVHEESHVKVEDGRIIALYAWPWEPDTDQYDAMEGYVAVRVRGTDVRRVVWHTQVWGRDELIGPVFVRRRSVPEERGEGEEREEVTTVVEEAPAPRWSDVAREEYDLLYVTGTKRTLVTRYCDPKGRGSDGSPAPWRVIAAFDSYNDAEPVLRKLRGY